MSYRKPALRIPIAIYAFRRNASANWPGWTGELMIKSLPLLFFFAISTFAQTPITFQYFYDDLGQLTRAVDSTGVSIEYVYDEVGNMLEVKRSNITQGTPVIFSFTP